MPHRKAKKVRVLKVKKVAPDVRHIELEVVGGAEPPAQDPPADHIDMVAKEPLPVEHRPWWSWLRDLF